MIKKSYVFFAIAFFFVLFGCAVKQIKHTATEDVNYIPYYLEVYKADSLRIIGKNKEAFEKLDSLFKKYKPLNQIFLYEMSNYVRLSVLEQRKENIKPVLENLFKEWGLNKERIKKDSLIKLALKLNNINDEDVEKMSAIFKGNLNADYQKRMEEIRFKDQEVRRQTKNNDTIRIVDDQNYKEFIMLLNEYGYPTYQKIDMNLSFFLKPFYMHVATSSADFEENRKMLVKYLKLGEATPEELYSFIDGKYFHQKKEFYFGDDGRWSYWSVIQIPPTDSIINRRKKYGLPSLEYTIWKNK